MYCISNLARDIARQRYDEFFNEIMKYLTGERLANNLAFIEFVDIEDKGFYDALKKAFYSTDPKMRKIANLVAKTLNPSSPNATALLKEVVTHAGDPALIKDVQRRISLARFRKGKQSPVNVCVDKMYQFYLNHAGSIGN